MFMFCISGEKNNNNNNKKTPQNETKESVSDFILIISFITNSIKNVMKLSIYYNVEPEHSNLRTSKELSRNVRELFKIDVFKQEQWKTHRGFENSWNAVLMF